MSDKAREVSDQVVKIPKYEEEWFHRKAWGMTVDEDLQQLAKDGYEIVEITPFEEVTIHYHIIAKRLVEVAEAP